VLPSGYPDDFRHDGLEIAWFRDIPWSAQRAVMEVNPRLRWVQNPVTRVFVAVLQLKSGDPQAHPFFGEVKLRGWLPVYETQRGFGVEILQRAVEGMATNARLFKERYGETPESVEAGLQKKRVETATRESLAMAESTAFARKFAEDFFRKHFGIVHSNERISVSSRKTRKLIAKARHELRLALIERKEAEDRKAFSLVTA
jgi:hypothetical protein